MADIGVKYDQDVATKGMAEGNVEILKDLHDPGRHGTKDAQMQHAHATTAAEDPPVEITHGHHPHGHKQM